MTAGRSEQRRAHRKCEVCGSTGTFIIPTGMLCERHAADILARTEAGSEDGWLPIRAERPDGAQGGDEGERRQ